MLKACMAGFRRGCHRRPAFRAQQEAKWLRKSSSKPPTFPYLLPSPSGDEGMDFDPGTRHRDCTWFKNRGRPHFHERRTSGGVPSKAFAKTSRQNGSAKNELRVELNFLWSKAGWCGKTHQSVVPPSLFDARVDAVWRVQPSSSERSRATSQDGAWYLTIR